MLTSDIHQTGFEKALFADVVGEGVMGDLEASLDGRLPGDQLISDHTIIISIKIDRYQNRF